jgi:flagellar basal-body rod protein FlgC
MIGAMDISMSGLIAQRTRLTAVASNIANISSMRNENNELEPYQARYVVLQTEKNSERNSAAAKVQVAKVDTATVEPSYRYDPTHPLAMKSGPHQGYVAYPNVDMMAEFVDALEATRAYEANVGVLEISKNMAQQTLRILA